MLFFAPFLFSWFRFCVGRWTRGSPIVVHCRFVRFGFCELVASFSTRLFESRARVRLWPRTSLEWFAANGRREPSGGRLSRYTYIQGFVLPGLPGRCPARGARACPRRCEPETICPAVGPCLPPVALPRHPVPPQLGADQTVWGRPRVFFQTVGG